MYVCMYVCMYVLGGNKMDDLIFIFQLQFTFNVILY